MGVPAELLGKQVRCPHCKQVVLAPVAAPPSGVIPTVLLPPPAPPQPLPPPPREPELPTFAVQRREGADSILSTPDESEDEVFGTQKGSRSGIVVPHDATAPARPGAADERPFEPAAPRTAPRPVSPGAPAPGPAAELPNPFLEPVSLPAVFSNPPAPRPAPPPKPPSAPQPQPAPRPAYTAPADDPFAEFDEQPPSPDEAETEADAPPRRRNKARTGDDEPDEKPTRVRARRPAPAAAGGGMTLLLIAVAVYALVATGLAVYGLFFRSGPEFDTGHPLSTIPDTFGEFDPAQRKRVSQYKFNVDGELPAGQRAKLGEKVTVGQLDIQPLRVERRPLVIETETARDKRTDRTPAEALVLTLLIENKSDLTFHPMDPAFTRRANEGKKDFPITRLVVDKKPYSGGHLEWPIDHNRAKRKFEQRQADDAVPLRPGDKREYVVFTEARQDIVAAVARAKEPLQWRVQVRRAPVEIDGREIPVTAIIGVEFRPADVKIGEWRQPAD